MSVFNYNPDIYEYLKNKAPSLLFGSNFSDIVWVFSWLHQDMEDDSLSFVDGLNLDTSGDFLDLIGSIVGMARNGFNDANYRNLIKAKILSNISKGRHSDIQMIANRVYGGEKTLILPIYPAAYALQVYVTGFFDYNQLPNFLELAYDLVINATGCGIEYQYLVIAEVGSFGFEDDDEALGFDDGGFAELQTIP